MDLAAVAPEAVGAAVLIVPICLDPAYGSLSSILKLVWRVVLPVLLFKLAPCALTQRWAGAGFLTDPGDIPRQVLLTWKHLRYNQPPPLLFEPGQLAGYAGPTLLVAADDDIFGDATRVVRRAREVLPGCEVVVLRMKHAPTAAQMEGIVARAAAFLAARSFGPAAS